MGDSKQGKDNGTWNKSTVLNVALSEREREKGDKIKCFHYSFGLPFPSFPFFSLSPLSLSLPRCSARREEGANQA